MATKEINPTGRFSVGQVLLACSYQKLPSGHPSNNPPGLPDVVLSELTVIEHHRTPVSYGVLPLPDHDLSDGYVLKDICGDLWYNQFPTTSGKLNHIAENTFVRARYTRDPSVCKSMSLLTFTMDRLNMFIDEAEALGTPHAADAFKEIFDGIASKFREEYPTKQLVKEALVMLNCDGTPETTDIMLYVIKDKEL